MLSIDSLRIGQVFYLYCFDIVKEMSHFYFYMYYENVLLLKPTAKNNTRNHKETVNV